MTTLNVDLGERSYPIYISGNIVGDAEIYKRHIAGSKVLVVTDENVAPHYLNTVLNALPDRSATRAYAENFSWDDTIEGVIDVFKTAISNA